MVESNYCNVITPDDECARHGKSKGISRSIAPGKYMCVDCLYESTERLNRILLSTEASLTALKDMLHKSETQAEQYRRELSALKNDARIVTEFAIQHVHSVKLDEAMNRILEATKEV